LPSVPTPVLTPLETTEIPVNHERNVQPKLRKRIPICSEETQITEPNSQFRSQQNQIAGNQPKSWRCHGEKPGRIHCGPFRSIGRARRAESRCGCAGNIPML